MKNKSGRLGRYMNRNEARKKDMSSWDRALSIGNDKWSVRDQKNVKNGHYVFEICNINSSPCCWQPDLGYFWVTDGSENKNFVLKKQFCVKILSKIEFWRFQDFQTLVSKSMPIFDFLFSLKNHKIHIFITLFNFDQILLIKSSPKPLYNLLG